MSNNTKSGLHWIVVGSLWLTLTACSSTSHLFVKKTELDALDQCLATQKSQQEIFTQQQAKLEETINMLSESLEEQKKLAAIPPPPPPPVERPRPIVCPKLPPRPVQATNVNDTAFQDKQVVGEKEQVYLNDLGFSMSARIDTGATTASMDARDIQTFERNGEEWVRFTVYHPTTREPVEVERKRVRRVHIVQSGAEEPERRPVVEMRITLGKITQNAEFTLADRSNLEQPMLIGRNVLRDVMLVDVSRSEIVPPVRPEKAPEPAPKAQDKPKAEEKPKAASEPQAKPQPQTQPQPQSQPEPKPEPQADQ
ncbi:MAG TPA: ATP-dependent zinc protease [Cellvibrio sp.]|nr:ATP-dependent zinc protease [Cellvibrio sp.]